MVRRTPPIDALAKNCGQDPLFPVFDYHPIITDRDGDLLDLEADHRRHAEVELTIRDLKHAMAMNPFPGLQRESGLARGRPERGRPGVLDQKGLLRRA